MTPAPDDRYRDFFLATSSDQGIGFAPLVSHTSPDIPSPIRARITQIERRFPALTVNAKRELEPVSAVTFLYERLIERWVVVHQGSGQPFGAAGTVQVACLATGMQLGDCLTAITQDVTGGRLLSPDMLADLGAWPAHAGPAEDDTLSQATASVLSMDARSGLVIVPGEKDATLPVLQRLSLMLPEDFARTLIWSTAFAGANTGDQRVITLDWPQVLGARHERERNNLYGRQQIVGDPSAIRGLGWIVAEARRDSFPLSGAEAGTAEQARDVLSAICPIEPEDALVALRSGRLAPEIAGRWVRDDVSGHLLDQDPRLMDELLSNPDSTVAQATMSTIQHDQEFWALFVGGQRQASQDSVSPPPVVRSLPRAERLRLATDVLRNSTVRQLHQARPWLNGLGLSPEDAPAFFPKTIEAIRAGLDTGTDEVHDLLTAGEQEAGVEGLLDQAVWVIDEQPDHIAELLVAAAIGKYPVELSPSWVVQRLHESFIAESLAQLVRGTRTELEDYPDPERAKTARYQIAEALVGLQAVVEQVDDGSQASQLLRLAFPMRRAERSLQTRSPSPQPPAQATARHAEERRVPAWRATSHLPWWALVVGGLLLLVTGTALGAFIW